MPGKFVCIAVVVLGIGLFAIPVGTVFEAFRDVLTAKQEERLAMRERVRQGSVFHQFVRGELANSSRTVRELIDPNHTAIRVRKKRRKWSIVPRPGSEPSTKYKARATKNTQSPSSTKRLLIKR